MVTKAKPRDLPVNLSCISMTSCTAPACEKSSCSSFSVVLNGRFPTYNLVAIESNLENAARTLFPLLEFQIAVNIVEVTIGGLPSCCFHLSGSLCKVLRFGKQSKSRVES